ncbi:RNA helicase [Olleya namhaensis]|uniref:RNA helicase n=2 Tax=Olleya namhaensis TaxID=1144750 RepID=A0A1I3STQ7_9FLAO|nr:RNA helicase [Olleya namhaensis]
MESIFNIINFSTMNFKESKKVAIKKKTLISTDELKQLFNYEAKKHYASKKRIFTVDKYNKNFLNLLCKYFAHDESFETIHKGELNKGLYVMGSHGTGKTTSFQIIQSISQKYHLKQLWFPIVSSSDIVQKYNLNNKKDYVVQNYSKGVFLFDDLGAEKEASNYGKEDIFIRIMLNRYNEYLLKGVKTHVTSNLSLVDIKNRYGSRVEDRFVEMFNFLEIEGTGKRE